MERGSHPSPICLEAREGPKNSYFFAAGFFLATAFLAAGFFAAGFLAVAMVLLLKMKLRSWKPVPGGHAAPVGAGYSSAQER